MQNNTSILVTGVPGNVGSVGGSIVNEFATPAFIIQRSQPFQCSQPGHEAIFAATYHNELWETVKTTTQWAFRNGKYSVTLKLVCMTVK